MGATAQSTLYPFSEFIDTGATRDVFRYNSDVAGGVTSKLLSQRLEVIRFFVPYDSLTKADGTSLAATGTILINSVPPAGGTLSIGSKTYTFVNGAPGATPNEINRDSGAPTATDIATRIKYAMMGTPGAAGTAGGYGAFTSPHHTASATNGPDAIPVPTVTVTAYRPGRAGNLIAFAKGGGIAGEVTLTPSTGTLSGGGIDALTAGTSYYYIDGGYQAATSGFGYFSQYGRRLVAWTFRSPTDPGGALQLNIRNNTADTGVNLTVTTGNNAAGDPFWHGRYQVSNNGGGAEFAANSYLQGFVSNSGGAVAPPPGSMWTLYLAREWV